MSPALVYLFSIYSQKSPWIRIILALPHVEVGPVLIATCSVPVLMMKSQHCGQKVVQNLSCEHHLLLQRAKVHPSPCEALSPPCNQSYRVSFLEDI